MIDFITTYSKEIGLIFFMAFFFGVIIQLYVRGKKTIYQNYANIPLQEDDK